MSEQVVVTGGSGFIGPHVLERFPGAINLDIKEGNDILECDLPPADVVIHLAAQPGVVASVEDPYSNARTNILGTIRLAKHYQDAKFIFASSGGTIQDEGIESPYGLSKKTCEDYIKLIHDNYRIVRFPNVYGKGSRSVVDKWLNEDEMTVYGDGNTYRIYAHVEDVADAVALAPGWDKGEYRLGTYDRKSVIEIARYISELTGKAVRFEPARKGEITHAKSNLDRKAPDWNPQHKVMEYINGICNNPK